MEIYIKININKYSYLEVKLLLGNKFKLSFIYNALSSKKKGKINM